MQVEAVGGLPTNGSTQAAEITLVAGEFGRFLALLMAGFEWVFSRLQEGGDEAVRRL